MQVEHCAITGVTLEAKTFPASSRPELAGSGRCFVLAEYLGAETLPARMSWESWIEAANSLGQQGWELIQVTDRQIWHGIPAWELPAPPSTTFYPGKLLVMKRAPIKP